MGGSESQPKANKHQRAPEAGGHGRRTSHRQSQTFGAGAGPSQTSPSSSSAASTPQSGSPSGNNTRNNNNNNNNNNGQRRPTLDELLAKVREGVATTHAMLSAHPPQDSPNGQGGQQAQIRAELERRLYVLLSYEERLIMAQQQENAELGAAPLYGGGAKSEKKKRLHPAVAQCPRITYTEEHARSDEEEKRQCSICWVEYEVGETVLILPCLHWVHDKCGEDWLQRKPQCPICQLDIIQSLRNCASYED